MHIIGQLQLYKGNVYSEWVSEQVTLFLLITSPGATIMPLYLSNTTCAIPTDNRRRATNYLSLSAL